uniref:Uncharacterized protein n=1 Tax=Branchiostoma floridae TaxID=7739 RepID=C3ZI02_BRAFL|eukprot:XP_002591846.1 hypothetical protein BRAFLDRAFT_88790 [Branchiostoma floridae]
MFDDENYSHVNLKEFSGHKDEVNCCAFSPDWEIMVTGCDDCLVRVWNTVSTKMVCKLRGHQGAVKSCAFSNDSKMFATASYDTTVRVWQTRTGDCIHVLQGHTKSVEMVVFSPDCTKLCSGSWDCSAIMWDVQQGCVLRILSGHSSLVQSCDFDYKDKHVATGSWDYTVRVWPVSPIADEKVKILRGHTSNVHAVVFARLGFLASGSWDKTVRLWNPDTSTLLFVLSGHTGWVKALAFSMDSLYLASAAEDETFPMEHAGTVQFSHRVLGSVVKHHTLDLVTGIGLRQ